MYNAYLFNVNDVGYPLNDSVLRGVLATVWCETVLCEGTLLLAYWSEAYTVLWCTLTLENHPSVIGTVMLVAEITFQELLTQIK